MLLPLLSAGNSRRWLLLAALLLSTVLTTQAQTAPVIGTTSFTGLGLTDYVTAQSSPATASNVGSTGWDFTSYNTGNVTIRSRTGTTVGNYGALGPNDPYIQCPNLTTGQNELYCEVKPNNNSAFKLTSVFLTMSASSGNRTITLTGYRNGVVVAGPVTKTIASNFTWVQYDVSNAATNPGFENIDTFRAAFASPVTPTQASIGVDEITIAAAAVAPTFTTQPSGASVCQGGTATLTAAANGTPTYQWYSNSSTNSNTGGTAISGATSASYSAPTTTGGTIYYYVVATNATGSTASNAVAVVVTATTAPTGAASQSFSSGATVASLAATGTAVQWYAVSTGGTALASTTALVNGTTYYASQRVSGCESQSRLAVTATVTAAATAPTVTTAAASSITSTSATLGGNVTADGGATITERGVVYVAGTGTPTTSNTKITASGTNGSYTASATGLSAGTQYTVRAYATNAIGTSYGSAVTFTTTAAAPANDDCTGAIALTPAPTCTPTSGTTLGATSSLPASACGGTADDDVWYSFVAGSANPTITVIGGSKFDAVVQLLSGTCAGLTSLACRDGSRNGGTETIVATGLTLGATYYVRVYEYYNKLTDNFGVPGPFTICVTGPAAPVNLVVDGTNSPYSASGSYNNVTINSGGTANLSGGLTVAGALTINSGGSLNTNCQALTGTGSFTLAAGGTLGICDDNGITASGSSGAVQVSGTRSFSPDASYVYNGGAVVQSTGTGLPATVRNLTLANAKDGDVALTQAVRIRQVLKLDNIGNFLLNGQALTLLSDASGTALVVNASTGVVSGGAVTVQRYIDGSLNSGPGYRHYSAPVSNTTVADLATSGFAPVLTQGYNTSATPGTTTPFPNVFGYDQSRLATVSNNYSAFDQGFVVPQSTDALTPGRGYAVNISAGELVDFVGTAGNGDITVNLARNAGATAADAGWALVGNPYPAPLNLNQLAAADRQNLDAAVYVVQSTGQYAGQYNTYANGQSTNTRNSLLTTAQGFFVRVSSGQTTGSLTFRNSQRVTDYDDAQKTTFQRTTADPRPALRLALAGNGLTDGWVTYAETGATGSFDKEYDAAKLPNPTGLNLSSTSGPERLAIDGQPAFTAATVLPLAVGVPTAGSYSLTASAIDNLPAGLTPYLRDAQTGTTTALAAGTSYAFAVTSAQAQALLLGRFTVQFAPAAPLAATSAALAASVSVYPNPARAQATVAVPGLAGTTAVQVELLNALGQVVLRRQAALPAGGTQLVLPTAELASGVYVVRLTAGELRVTKRLTLE